MSKVRLVLILSGIAHLPAWAQSASTFTPTGAMTTSRWVHTATLLNDGTVLVAGGTGGGKILSSAELYDPRTGTFAPTGEMNAPRYGHTATLLPDGKVLIVGGVFDPEGLTGLRAVSAELYDPVTKSFTLTGSTAVGRSFHFATLMADGKVLVAGGMMHDPTPFPLPLDASAELYDPSTGQFTRTGDMAAPVSRDVGAATLLASGKVLITRDHYTRPPVRAELYDPSTGTFKPTGNPSERFESTGTLLTNGKVLVAAGADVYGEPTGFGELYDPAFETFSATENMTMARDEHTATLLSDGSVLITGGCICGGPAGIGPFDRAEVYDPRKATFSSAGDMTAARHSHTATLLKDGRVLIAGGAGFWNGFPSVLLASTEIYTPAALIPAPVLLSLSGDGTGPGAIQHASTYEVVSRANPAVTGEVLIIYCTGLADGSVIPPHVAIGGRTAEVLWFGNTPGFVGLNQINVRIPSGVGSGPAVSVRLNYIGRPSNEVTIGVR